MIPRSNVFIILAFAIWSSNGMPTNSRNVVQGAGDNAATAFYYLLNYGYITKDENEQTAALMSEEVVTKAVKDFQVFAGIEPTGTLNNETLELMGTPRCGVKDRVGPSTNARRRKRYALQGSRWRVKELTWRISKYPSSNSFSKSEVDSEIKKAFQLWEDNAGLKFKQKKSGTAHIDIRFEKYEHGDGDPFDGQGGTLAHAFFPQYGGDAHFDDTEYWTINSFRGTNLLQTAAHEFGHSLGLSHSDDRRALMAPFYRGWEPDLKLKSDDIAAIQALYGPAGEDEEEDKPDEPSRPTRPPNRPQRPDNGDLCDAKIDAVFSTDGTFYVFKGENYWKLTDDSVADGYPKKIKDDWPGLPNNIDAAVTWENGKTFFFKGSKYWRFSGIGENDPGYPKNIKDNFPGIPDNVDTAFVWGGNGKIYFFKGDEYWRFDPHRKPAVSDKYPADIDNWDLPDNIEAAVQWSNRHTYFFKNGEYYRFNDRRFTIDNGDPPFPRPSGPWWFGCPKKGALRKDAAFVVKALKANKESFARSFDEEGDELLDVIPPDE